MKKNKLTKKQKRELAKIIIGGIFTIVIYNIVFILWFIK